MLLVKFRQEVIKQGKYIFRAAQADKWLRQSPPEITFYGFHAEGAALDRGLEIFKELEWAHKTTTGEEFEFGVTTATSDMRFYNLYYNIPATCYGPLGGNMHGADEWVDLESVKAVTKTYAAFILSWCGVHRG